MDNIFWTGYSNNERNSTINSIKRVIAKYGDIVDFRLFSDISINMVIEIEEFKIDELYDELAKNIGLEKFKHLNSTAKNDRKLYLNVTFTKATGNLKIEVPAVPG